MPEIHRLDRRFVPRKTGDGSALGQLESAVMDIVWTSSSPLSVGDVHDVLPPEPTIAYNTVKTTMERLAEKGILSRLKAGKAYRYQAAISQEGLERRIVSQILDDVVEQFPRAVASFFSFPDPGISDGQLSLLLEAVERHRESGDA